jgi:hypothetical protein
MEKDAEPFTLALRSFGRLRVRMETSADPFPSS